MQRAQKQTRASVAPANDVP